MSQSKFIVTASGMASSLGGCLEACAAHHAGLMRPQTLPLADATNEMSTDDENDSESQAALVCDPVASFDGYARLANLLSLAAKDLFDNSSIDLDEKTNSALIIVLPDAAQRPALTQSEQALKQNGEKIFLETFNGLSPEFSHIVAVEFVRGAQASVYQAWERASELLESGSAERCFIAAADSYMDLSSLQWLLSTGQLMTPDKAEGMIPGEGAAIVEVRNAAKNSSGTTLDFVVNGNEAAAYDNLDHNFTGDVFTQLMATVFEQCKEIDCQYLLTDLNGQALRAKELSIVQIRVKGNYGADLELWTSTSSFGDVGAATGLFQLCLAMSIFESGDAGAKNMLLCSASYSGERGCALLSFH